MAQPDEHPKVSTFYRVLAWVFVVCSILALASGVMLFRAGQPLSLSWAEIVLGAMGLLLIVPAAFAVAFTGRPPRWWRFVDESLDIEKVLKQRVEKRDKR